jgi:hypothetical protein
MKEKRPPVLQQIVDNLNSIYFPGEDCKSVYSSMIPVNSFRAVLNKFFSGNLSFLKDNSIFITHLLPEEK